MKKIKYSIVIIGLILPLLSCENQVYRENYQFDSQQERKIAQSYVDTQTVESTVGSDSENFQENSEAEIQNSANPASNEQNSTAAPNYGDNEVGGSNFVPAWWRVVAISSFVLSFILGVLLFFLFRKNSQLFRIIDGKNDKLNSKKWEIKNLENTISQLKSKDKNNFSRATDQQNKTVNKQQNRTLKKQAAFYPDESPVEVVLSPTSTTMTQPKNVNTVTTLYAGKPGKENIFTEVSPQKDEHRSFYRLTLEYKDAQTASFEVLDTEYILRMAANSPDTYLFSVCKPENSNQNFDGKIITTQKGTARLLDGSWKVNDEDKAKIKFE